MKFWKSFVRSFSFKYKKKKTSDVIIMEKPATSSLGLELVDASGHVNKSAIEQEVEARLKEFKSFDYSQSDYSVFESKRRFINNIEKKKINFKNVEKWSQKHEWNK